MESSLNIASEAANIRAQYQHQEDILVIAQNWKHVWELVAASKQGPWNDCRLPLFLSLKKTLNLLITIRKFLINFSKTEYEDGLRSLTRNKQK